MATAKLPVQLQALSILRLCPKGIRTARTAVCLQGIDISEPQQWQQHFSLPSGHRHLSLPSRYRYQNHNSGSNISLFRAYISQCHDSGSNIEREREREVDQGHQPGEESDSKTNGSQGQSQEAVAEATPSPVEQERVSQPAVTARTLRSGRDTQKGRSQSQSSIVDSFRRMQSSDRTKDNQARKGGKQDRSASASNR